MRRAGTRLLDHASQPAIRAEKAGGTIMPTFILTINWTDQGIHNVKDSPKRTAAARELGKKMGVDLKQIFLTSGESDLLAIVETPNGDNVAKFCMALAAQGNIRTRTARAWPEAEYAKLISELP